MDKFSYKSILFFAILVHIVTAFMSKGFLHPDEYYYSIDFMLFKFNQLPSNFVMSWEFNTQIRPWTLPYLFMLLCYPLKILGITSPFSYVLWLRLLVGAFSFFASCRFAIWSSGFIKSDNSKKLNYFLQLLLWPAVFMHVRTSSDNVSTAFFLLALPFLFSKNIKRIFVSGLMIGMIFSLRHQMGILGLFVGLYTLFGGHITKKQFFAVLVPGILITVSLGLVFDILGYGQITFTPWNYLYQNIVVGKMASFGTHPWWYYFKLIVIKLGPPIGIPLLFALLKHLKTRKLDIWFWAILPFFAFHILLSHKELRFLYPLLPLLTFLLVFYLPTMKGEKIIVRLLLVTNFLMLPFACFRAAYTPIKIYQWLYDNNVKQLSILPDRKSRFLDLELKGFLPSNLIVLKTRGFSSLKGFVLVSKREQIIAMSRKCTLSYSSYPLWLIESNPLGFAQKSNTWSIFSCLQ